MDWRTSETAVHTAFGDITVTAGSLSVSSTEGRTDDNTNGSGLHQRRRVNPESLALRLGPDLVRDLDALITPGNTEMPSFAIRKELQERYNIDRRHIYDYFHSRGLRVVKEDKHGNLAGTRDLPGSLQANVRPLRQAAPIKTARSHPSHPLAAEGKFVKPRGITKAKPGRPKKNPSMNPKVVPEVSETNESNESTDTAPVSEHSPCGSVPTLTYVAVNPLLPHVPQVLSVVEDENSSCTFNSAVNLLDESFSVRRAIGDIAYAYRHKLVFERMQELTEHPAKTALPDDRLLSWNETSPCSASGKGLLLPHAKALTRDERDLIYETLSSSLGPAHGIQECQGTYRKHMEARAKLYFEGLLSPYQTPLQPVRTSTLLDRKVPLGTNEFRHWLSETRFLKRDGIDGSPRYYSNHRNADMTKRHDISEATNNRFRHRSVPYWRETLDELFPAPEDNLNRGDPITDSPVQRTREATGIVAHTRGVPNQHGGARDQIPFLGAPNPILPYSLPVSSTSITGIRPLATGHIQIHGVPDFPGSQDVETLVADADDHHLLWPELVPHAVHAGQHLSLSNALWRARNMANNARTRLPSGSPRKPHIRDLDRVWTKPATSRDARRRTPSAAGDI